MMMGLGVGAWTACGVPHLDPCVLQVLPVPLRRLDQPHRQPPLLRHEEGHGRHLLRQDAGHGFGAWMVSHARAVRRAVLQRASSRRTRSSTTAKHNDYTVFYIVGHRRCVHDHRLHDQGDVPHVLRLPARRRSPLHGRRGPRRRGTTPTRCTGTRSGPTRPSTATTIDAHRSPRARVPRCRSPRLDSMLARSRRPILLLGILAIGASATSMHRRVGDLLVRVHQTESSIGCRSPTRKRAARQGEDAAAVPTSRKPPPTWHAERPRARRGVRSTRCHRSPPKFSWVNAMPRVDRAGRARVPRQPRHVHGRVRAQEEPVQLFVGLTQRKKAAGEPRALGARQQVRARRPVRERDRPGRRPPHRARPRTGSTRTSSTAIVNGVGKGGKPHRRPGSTSTSTRVLVDGIAVNGSGHRGARGVRPRPATASSPARSTSTARCSSAPPQSVRIVLVILTICVQADTHGCHLRSTTGILSLGTFLPLVGVLVMLFIPKPPRRLLHKQIAHRHRTGATLACRHLDTLALSSTTARAEQLQQFGVNDRVDQRSSSPATRSASTASACRSTSCRWSVTVPRRDLQRGTTCPTPGNPKSFLMLMLVLQVGMAGSFIAQDLILFFVFFEDRAAADVLHDRRVGRRAAPVRLAQVLPLHDVRIGA